MSTITNGKYHCGNNNADERIIRFGELTASLVFFIIGWYLINLCVVCDRKTIDESLVFLKLLAVVLVFVAIFPILMVAFYSITSSIIDLEGFCREGKYNVCKKCKHNVCKQHNSTELLCSITSPNIKCIKFRFEWGFISFAICMVVILSTSLISMVLFPCLRDLCRETREIIDETAEIVVKVEQ